MEFSQLWPEPGKVEIGAHLAGLGLGQHAPGDRAYAVANFVSSLDGRATFHGRSGALGDPGDREMFRALRESADAVLIGAGTLRTERYGRVLREPEGRERRRAAGRPAEPWLCTMTRSGAVPLDLPLFEEPEARVIIFSAGPELDVSGVQAQVELVHVESEALSVTDILRYLRARHDVRLALCEGGPTVLGQMLREGVLDELFLTMAPKLTGGGAAPGVSAGPELPELAAMTLAGVLEHDGTLFLRYRAANPTL